MKTDQPMNEGVTDFDSVFHKYFHESTDDKTRLACMKVVMEYDKVLSSKLKEKSDLYDELEKKHKKYFLRCNELAEEVIRNHEVITGLESKLKEKDEEIEKLKIAFNQEVKSRAFHYEQENFYHSKLKEAHKIIDDIQSQLQASNAMAERLDEVLAKAYYVINGTKYPELEVEIFKKLTEYQNSKK